MYWYLVLVSFFCAILVLMMGLEEARSAAASRRKRVEEAQVSGETETARQMAKQLTRSIRNILLRDIGMSLVPIALGIGFLVEPNLAFLFCDVAIIALIVLFSVLAIASLINTYIGKPLGSLVRDLRFGRQVEHDA